MEWLESIQAGLNYRFQNTGLLSQALTHPSYVNERTGKDAFDNERLEFLGDAVLNMVITHMIMEGLSDHSEGELTRVRASMVNQRSLAGMARQMELGRFLFLGKGEDQTGGRGKASILAACYEAVVGAVYLDGGYGEAFRMLRTHFSEILTGLARKRPPDDFKSLLQEQIQGQYKTIPRYKMVSQTGPDHEKRFCVSVSVQGVAVGHGEGKTKKEAEQQAAKVALEKRTITGR